MMDKITRRSFLQTSSEITLGGIAGTASAAPVVAQSPSVHPQGEPVPIRVMSYNIHHGEGSDNVLNLKRIADVIRKSNADLVGLQEVDNEFSFGGGSSRSNFVFQARRLADYLDMRYVYGANLDYENINGHARQYGTAVLSKHEFPILKNQNHVLPKIEYENRYSEQRGLLETQINVQGNKLYFYVTHLALTPEQRQLQTEQIAEIMDRREGIKILVGDFNALPGSIAIETVSATETDVFASLEKDQAYTYPAPYGAEEPYKRIDYIFASEDILIYNAAVLRTIASDHLPIVADLALTQRTPYLSGHLGSSR